MALSIEERKRLGQQEWFDGKLGQPVREKRIDRIAEAMIAIDKAGSRPKVGLSTELDEWDRNYLDSKISLEAFFSPRECVQVIHDAQARKLSEFEENFPGKDSSKFPEHLRIQDIRRFWFADVDPDKNIARRTVLSFCSMRVMGHVNSRHVDIGILERIFESLEERGVPDRLLKSLLFDETGKPKSTFFSYSADLTLEGMRVAGEYRENSRFRKPDGPFAQVYSDLDLRETEGLREKDVLEFIQSPGNDQLRVTPHSPVYFSLKRTNEHETPMAQLMKSQTAFIGENDGKKHVDNAILTAFLAEKVGIAHTSIDRDTRICRQSYGRLEMKLENTTSSGIKVGVKPYFAKLASGNPFNCPSVYVDENGQVSENLRINLGVTSAGIIRGVSNGRSPGGSPGASMDLGRDPEVAMVCSMNPENSEEREIPYTFVDGEDLRRRYNDLQQGKITPPKFTPHMR